MKKYLKKSTSWNSLLAVALLAGCSLLSDGRYGVYPFIPGSDGQKEVRVRAMDATTMQPLEGVIVVGGYYGRSYTGGYACVKTESGVSDAGGWLTLPNDQDPRAARLWGPMFKTAYKRGYRTLPDSYFKVEQGGKGGWYVEQLDLTSIAKLDRGEWTHNHGYPTSPLEWTLVGKYEDEKSALLASGERTVIYLMPSTAKTKEEREKELRLRLGGCSPYPFAWSVSEGGIAVEKAAIQELMDLDYYSERGRKGAEEKLKFYEEALKEIRDKDAAKGE